MKGYILLLFVLFTVTTYAQTSVKITGKVMDAATHQPVEYATLTLQNRADKKVINGAISDSLGAFTISGVPTGSYTLIVEFIGYQKNTIDSLSVGNKNISLGTVSLYTGGQTLKDVTVTADKPIIENKIDKLVYNAENDITAQGGQALDVLKKVPQVNVDLDGNVELQGNSNIRFLINGKPSSVFGNSVTDALAAIPASQIKSIEVITSPGAKYDAQGTGGIINIILKDSKMQGINGNINLSAGTRLESGSVNINYRHNKFGLNTYFNTNAQLVSSTPYSQDRTSIGTGVANHLLQDGYNQFQRNSYQTGISMDWDLTKKDNITAGVSFDHYAYINESNLDVEQDTLSSSAPPILSTRHSNSRFFSNSLDWSMGYKKKYKKEGQELDVQYSASYGEPGTYYKQNSNYKGQATDYAGTSSNNPGTDLENNISVDYTQPIREGVEIETGVKTVLQNIHSSASVSALQPTTQSYLSDPGQSYSLDYNMQIYAAYLSASFPMFNYLKVKAGARYEYTNVNIDFPNTTVPSYGTLVPSVTLSHDLKNGQFIKLSYSKRIERADYRDINPFLNFADPYNVSTGNPLLKPEIGNNMELGYNRSLGNKGNFYVAVIERINTQDHKSVTTFYTDYAVGDTVYHNISLNNWQNVGTEYNSGINISGSYTIKDKLSLRSNITFMHRHSEGFPTATYNSDGDRFRANLNVSYQFPNNLITEVFGNYNSATNNIQGKTPQWVSYSFAFRKQFWNKNASIGFTANNFFSEYIKQVTTVDAADYNSVTVRLQHSRSVGISFTYKFGKLEFKKDREDESYQDVQQ